LKKTTFLARQRSDGSQLKLVIFDQSRICAVYNSPFPPFHLQAFADELHAREFQIPRREVECVSQKRAVMQASEPAMLARICGCSRFFAVLRRQWRQRACLRRRGKGFGRMQQLFVREGFARAGAVGSALCMCIADFK
jgi:hypothetical protein